jgi:methylmalonyl-CoA/ethylmalonyl-CoA epimerase
VSTPTESSHPAPQPARDDSVLEAARAGAALAAAESRARWAADVERRPPGAEPTPGDDSLFAAALAGAALAAAESRAWAGAGAPVGPAAAPPAPAAAEAGPGDGSAAAAEQAGELAAPIAAAATQTVAPGPQPTGDGGPPPPLPIHHIGIAVSSIDEAMRFYGEKLGLDIADRLELPERSLRVAFVRTGNTLIELLEPTNTESTVARFIERRGQGLHHLCFGTADIAEHLRDLKDKGVELIDQVARPGAHGDVAFIAPAAAYGVLVELLQELPPDKLAAREDVRPY